MHKTPVPTPDLSPREKTTLEYVEDELRRLKKNKKDASIMLWFDFNGYIDWTRIDEAGLKHLLKFLLRCD